MITVDGKLHTVKVHDASSERKTTDNLLRELDDVVKVIEDEWGAVVIAVVTDASGESRKAQKINLIVGDYFKCKAYILVYTDQATELIGWLHSKTLVLALIPVLTQWTAHYLAFNQLLDLQETLVAVVYGDEVCSPADRKIVIGDKKAKAKSREMIAVIKNPLFWHAILRITCHLWPLAIAANVIQAAYCRIDQVLLTFGFLMMQYVAMDNDDDQDDHDAIMASIEKQWAKADQENRGPDPKNVYNDFCFTGQPTPPFIRLALHVLSISANSASCKHLFSVFGNTLTKLRNRLGTDLLTALAELKMHIRNEHVQKQSKDRVKRQFKARQATTTSMPPPTPITPVFPEPVTTATSDDDNDPEPSSDIQGIPVPICDLFNFSATTWVNAYAQVAKLSFDEELDLYELLDLNADGEDDVDVSVDESMDDILIG
ncbi:hypothetical protein DXG01_003329 [Tephrocybe rancida]|nr:hypothetical protein DXG01_003329 [Tephrocybe rancida]